MTATVRLQKASVRFNRALRRVENSFADDEFLAADEELREAAIAFDRSLTPRQRALLGAQV